MTGRELAFEVHKCLTGSARKRVRKEDVYLIVKLMFETISDSILCDDVVRIRNFGKIRAKVTKGGKMVYCAIRGKSYPRKPNVKVIFEPARRLRSKIGMARAIMRAHAKKEQEAESGEIQLRGGGEEFNKGGIRKGEMPKVRESVGG